MRVWHGRSADAAAASCARGFQGKDAIYSNRLSTHPDGRARKHSRAAVRRPPAFKEIEYIVWHPDDVAPTSDEIECWAKKWANEIIPLVAADFDKLFGEHGDWDADAASDIVDAIYNAAYDAVGK